MVSHPQQRCFGDHGKHNSSFTGADQRPDLTMTSGTSVHYLATHASTDSHFGLYRWNMGAEPSGPSPHFHKTISESFFVLDGVVRLFDGARWTEATAGDFLHVAPGGIHAFRNESGAASMLLLFAPGAPRGRYFESLAEIARDGRQLSDEQWTQLFAAHDQYMV